MSAFSLWLMKGAWLPHEALNLMLASAGGVLLYLIIMLLTGIVDRYDAMRLPIIGRLFK